jgi:MoaA/NifB/PqqE/SkfB family radical SAM enzyme
MISNSKDDIILLRKKQTDSTINSVKDALQSITVNPTELCNRRCSFCPRSDSKVYPNRNLHIDLKTVVSLSNSLKSYGFNKRLGWSGNGEPLLTKDFLKLTKIVSDENPELKVHEINTNGDILTRELIYEIYNSGINHIIVSVYDGQHRMDECVKMFSEFSSDRYTLRNTFSGNLSGFTNRGGLVDVNRENVKLNHSNKCYLPFYKIFIDWNGDVLVCCEDWSRKSKSRLNINTHTLEEIWLSDELSLYRNKLRVGDRSSLELCKSCNIDGERVGGELVNLFYE